MATPSTSARGMPSWPRSAHAGAADMALPPSSSPRPASTTRPRRWRASREIYDGSVDHLRDALQSFVDGEALGRHVRACYPFVRVHTDTVARADSRLSYGFVAGPGTYETTLTRPDLFGDYYLEQFRLLLENHGVALEVGTSAQPIPVHFSFAEHDHIEGSLTPERRLLLRDLFDLPDLGAMDDGIANGTYDAAPGRGAAARALHRAARRLLAAPPAPLHRHRPRALPELRAVHELPVLHRRVRAPRPRDDGRRRRRRSLRRLRRAGQRDRRGRAGAPAQRATTSARRRRACRRCRPTTWCATTAAASRWSTSASARPTPRPSPTTSRCCARTPG